MVGLEMTGWFTDQPPQHILLHHLPTGTVPPQLLILSIILNGRNLLISPSIVEFFFFTVLKDGMSFFLFLPALLTTDLSVCYRYLPFHMTFMDKVIYVG